MGTITYIGSTSNPLDNATLYDTQERSITPLANMLTGDLVRLRVDRKLLTAIAMSALGGQTWFAGSQRQTGSSTCVIFWCRFNGTWTGGNPSIVTALQSVVIILKMNVARSSVASDTWALDAAENYHAVPAPVSPFDFTATGRTTVASNVIAFADYESIDLNTWAGQTANWANAGTAQIRNPDPSLNKHLSISSLYRIFSAPSSPTGNPVNRQVTLGGDAGLWVFNTWKTQAAGISISSVGDSLIHQGETGIVITGTGFGASHTGSADVIICLVNAVGDASAVIQTQTAWANTSVTFTASGLTTFPYATDLYVFVKDSSGASNSSGFVIRREAIINLSGILKNLAGVVQASLSNLKYRVTLTDINGTLVTSGSALTTNGSGAFTIGPVYAADVLADNVWASIAFDGASLALSPATLVKVTPTYT